jgi:hypothetical protein
MIGRLRLYGIKEYRDLGYVDRTSGLSVLNIHPLPLTR